MKKFKLIALALVTVLLVAAFAGCTPSAEDLKEKYEAADYITGTLTEAQAEEWFGDIDGEVEWSFIAWKGLNFVYCSCYKEAADAKEAYDNVLADDPEAHVVKKGNAVIVATSQTAIDVIK